MNPKYKRVLQPGFLAALEHFSTVHFGLTHETSPVSFVYTDPKTKHQTAWTVERVCHLAHQLLADEKLHFLKLVTLKAGMKDMGASRMYEHIMGEKIDAQEA